jgi:hypothetical protein
MGVQDNVIDCHIGRGLHIFFQKKRHVLFEGIPNYLILGCRLFQGVAADGGIEKGMYCYCMGENCNTGDIAYPLAVNGTTNATSTTTTTAPSG